ncbi:hypothetical protein [Terrimonas ferruginea]|uniref:hypothetical protein n=1 Tax=Terrimonas ferruginea TaxID=249 RepID=UPI00040C75E3|nr:hypothetical protein [Terrimonas ferruginea]
MSHLQAPSQKKKVLLFKQVDITLQLILIPAAIIYGFLEQRPFYFLLGYFVVGGWQLTSYFIHFFLRKKFVPSGERRWYGQFVAILLTIALLCLLVTVLGERLHDFTLLYLVILLAVTPFFAVKYLTISIVEARLLKQLSEKNILL